MASYDTPTESDFKHFLETYSFDTCSDNDVSIHRKLLTKFFNIFGSSIDTNNLTMFDIGCNAGSFIKVVKTLPFANNIKIHSFEPHPALCKYVKNKYTDVISNEYCLTNTVGKGHIYIPSQSVLISSIINRPVFDILRTKPGADKTIQKVWKYETKFNTIDNYCKENDINSIDYIKLDVEGAEYMVFEGAAQMLKNRKIKGGQFEGTPGGTCLKDAGASFDMIKTLLNSHGYEVILDSSTPNDVLFYLKSTH
jgi:FkbM family methyltransferase